MTVPPSQSPIPPSLSVPLTGTTDVTLDRVTGVAPGIYTNPTVQFDATGRAISAVSGVAAGGRTMLTQNLDWYVSPTGSNSTGDGSQAKPFTDPVYAYQLAQQTLDLGGKYTITCHLQGNFTNAAWSFQGGLTGALSPNSFILLGGGVFGAPGGIAIIVGNFAGIHCVGLSMVPGPGGFGFVVMSACGSILAENCFGNTNSGHTMFDAAGTGCSIVVRGFTLTQNAGNIDYFAVAEDSALIAINGLVTFNGGVTWNGACVQADLAGQIDATGVIWSMPGGVGGVRFNAIPPGIVFTGQGGSPPNFFPGSLPGSGASPWYQ